MYCEKCGFKNEDGAEVCTQCNNSIGKVALGTNTAYSDASKKISCVLPVVLYALAVIVVIMSFASASDITEGANEIMLIRSVGGKTLEEVYYQEVGKVYLGYATAIRMVGIFFASALVYFGISLKTFNKNN